MADPSEPNTSALSTPKVSSGFSISPIWIFPFVALLIGGWLVYQTLSQQGPKITISFKTADGIEATKTKLKFREVEIGIVTAVDLKKDLSGVIVTAELSQEAEAHLKDTTKFWVVRPRLGLKGVSGLGTLVSGAFIEISPGKAGETEREFIGLEEPPSVTIDEPGKEFTLVTNKLGSYTTGSPLYYRGIEVGEVLGQKLADNRIDITVRVFIHEPHDQLIRDDTRFWNASGLSVSLGADGMKLNMESLQALALGGIAFDTPSDLTSGIPSKAGTRFRLYDSEEAIEEAQFTQKFRWLLNFEGSVRGLVEGAPVEFKGLRVGNVVSVRLEFDRDQTFRIPVLIDIEPERVSVRGEGGGDRVISRKMHIASIKQLVAAGLRARVKSGNLITGQLLVDLDFHPDTKVALRGDGSYPEIPTIPSSIEEITQSLTALLNKIQGLPLDELTRSATRTMKSAEKLVGSQEIPRTLQSFDQALSTVNRVLNSVDNDIAPKLESALGEADQTLRTVREAVTTGSPLRYNLETTLEELASAARSIRLLAEYLESNPNALIYGKGGRPAQ